MKNIEIKITGSGDVESVCKALEELREILSGLADADIDMGGTVELPTLIMTYGPEEQLQEPETNALEDMLILIMNTGNYQGELSVFIEKCVDREMNDYWEVRISDDSSLMESVSYYNEEEAISDMDACAIKYDYIDFNN